MENETYTNVENSEMLVMEAPKPDSAETIDVPQMSMYEANKQLMMETGKPISKTKLKSAVDNIVVRFRKWVWDKGYKYFMMLCKERSDYTLFNITEPNFDLDELKIALCDCFVNRGLVYDIHYEKNADGYEIWLKIEDQYHVYYLFPYDIGVIEIGGTANA